MRINFGVKILETKLLAISNEGNCINYVMMTVIIIVNGTSWSQILYMLYDPKKMITSPHPCRNTIT